MEAQGVPDSNNAADLQAQKENNLFDPKLLTTKKYYTPQNNLRTKLLVLIPGCPTYLIFKLLL